MNRDTRNPRVPAVQPKKDSHEVRVHPPFFFFALYGCISNSLSFPKLMATLKEGDRWQMWEFVPL